MENENLEGMFKKLDKEKPNSKLQDFIFYATEYVMNSPDKIPELIEGIKEIYGLIALLKEGEVSAEELPLLMSPTIKEVSRYICEKLLKENEK